MLHSLFPGEILRLNEELVQRLPYKVEIKYGNESRHNRPHVQCTFHGETSNISIDGNIELLADDGHPKRYANQFINQLKNNNELLQSARRIWNKGGFLYQFIEQNGKLIPR